MSDILDTEPTVEAVKEPAKRWRNWWRFYEPQVLQCVVCGHEDHVTNGDFRGAHCKRYLSLEEATAAARSLDAMSDENLDREWLGAFPEGERP